FDLSVCDWLATFSQHISYQICRVLNENSIKNVLITGGGAYNSYLLHLIKSQTKAQVHLPEKKIIEYKEALIFGLLGLLRLENQVNVLSSVTGAKKNHCSGCVVNENS
ncbi:MAG: anhydro-N-acetylmuramic acid kinase, partial [Weeksellaceae bacterium]|nr:anhydro-N-acetylmuramic acid kinase [Weeksellaceae bacterium]